MTDGPLTVLALFLLLFSLAALIAWAVGTAVAQALGAL